MRDEKMGARKTYLSLVDAGSRLGPSSVHLDIVDVLL